MRKLLLLVSILLLGACWAVAQGNSSPTNPASPSSSASQSDPASSQSTSGSQTSPEASSSGQMGSSNANGHTTVEGCLSGSSGNYTLSAKDGTSYQLTGDTAKLSEHVGHEVKITGTSSSASPSGGGTATGTTGQPNGSSQTLEVSSVKHISKTCQNGGMSK